MRITPWLSGPRLALQLLTLLVLAPGWAADPLGEFEAIRRSSLKGIESLEVIVLPALAPPGCRLSPEEQIQTEVEARLRRAEIPLGPGTPAFLFVSMAAIEAVPDRVCGVFVSVELHQVVLLARDARITTFGATWHKAGLGVVSTPRIPESLRQMLTDIANSFISVYWEQNPKK